MAIENLIGRIHNIFSWAMRQHRLPRTSSHYSPNTHEPTCRMPNDARDARWPMIPLAGPRIRSISLEL